MAVGRRIASALQVVAYLGGAAVVTTVTSALYGVSSAPRGSYLEGLLVAAAAGGLHYLVLRVSRYLQAPVAAAVVVVALLSFVGGHVVAYGEAQDFAWNYVHRIAPEKFEGAEWRGLDRSGNFRQFVGWVTGTPGGGAWAYLRLQSAIGTGESRMGRAGRQAWVVAGLGVWTSWGIQVLMLIIALAASVGAALPNPAPTA